MSWTSRTGWSQVRRRAEVTAGQLLHRCTYALIRRSTGEIHVQRRTETKATWPGAYDMLPGGVCDAGEGYDDCIRRELAEELAIVGVEPRSGCCGTATPARTARPGARCTRSRGTGPVTNQPEEVAWSGWATPRGARAAARRPRPSAPTACEIYRRLVADGLVD